MPGTPANSPRVGAPRFANADGVDFAGQVNGVTDAFDAKVVIDRSSTFATRPAANTVAAGTYHFSTNTGHVARSDGTAWHEVGRTLSAAGLTIGTANLYELGADQLKTDDQFFTGGAVGVRDGTPTEYVQIGGATTPIIYFGGALDAYIRRWAANLLRIGGALELDGGATKAVGGVENLRTLRGTVNADGTIAAGSGFTVTKGGPGFYTINFSTAFAAVPGVILTPVTDFIGSTAMVWSAPAPAAGAVTVALARDLVANNNAFSFIATGPR